MRFTNRAAAGRVLGSMLREYADRPDVLVLALPRGGVPVAYEVAHLLNVPMDLFLVRKLGVPGHEELAMGAIASGGIIILNSEVTRTLGIPMWMIDRVAAAEGAELARRERAYRGDRPAPVLSSRTAILVDDGLATGSSMRAAVRAAKSQKPSRIIVAVPVAPPETCEALRQDVDEVCCAYTPDPFSAVSLWYEDFSQTTDEEVKDLYEKAAHRPETVPG